MRTCSECNRKMSQGYVIENGIEYYCSDDCLHLHISPQEYEQMHNDGEGESYWTEWEQKVTYVTSQEFDKLLDDMWEQFEKRFKQDKKKALKEQTIERKRIFDNYRIV